VFTSFSLIRKAALAGLGLAYLPEDRVQADVREGRLAFWQFSGFIEAGGSGCVEPAKTGPSLDSIAITTDVAPASWIVWVIGVLSDSGMGAPSPMNSVLLQVGASILCHEHAPA
jgi:hypothetical protein